MKRKVAMLTGAVAVCLSMGSTTLRADAVSENTNFVEEVYLDLLQRPASTIEIASGLGALGSETHFQFALSIDTSNEYYQLLVGSYFQGLLGRPASTLEIASGLSALGSETRFQFALSIDTSNEYYQLLAGSYVQDLLGRPATPTDISVFTALLSSNSDEFVQAQIAGSAEFFLKSGSSDAGFVTALFKDFLNRTPSSSEVAFWVGALGTMSREQVAALILGTLEYDSDLVKSYYLQFLQRPADSTGLNFFANALNGGTRTDEQVIASLIGTDEYFNLAQPGAAQTPEPRTVALLGLGLATFILLRRQLAG